MEDLHHDASRTHLRPPPVVRAHDDAHQFAWKIGLHREKWLDSHFFEICLAETGFAQHRFEMRLRKLVKFVFRNKGLETFPGYLHILESVIDISRGQLYPMFIDAKFARSGFQKIRQGGEVEGTTEQRCRHGLEVDKRPPTAGRLDASPACSAACPLFCLKCIREH
jgi:hypothetical protein